MMAQGNKSFTSLPGKGGHPKLNISSLLFFAITASTASGGPKARGVRHKRKAVGTNYRYRRGEKKI